MNLSAWSLRFGSSSPPVRLPKVDLRPDGDDLCRVDRWDRVVARLHLLQVDRVRNSWHLIELARVTPEVRVVLDTLQIAFEITVIGEIESDQGREQAPIRFRYRVTEQVAVLGET